MKLVTNPKEVYDREAAMLSRIAHEEGLLVKANYYGRVQIAMKDSPFLKVWPRQTVLANCHASLNGSLNYFTLYASFRRPEKREQVLDLLRGFEEECGHEVSVEE